MPPNLQLSLDLDDAPAPPSGIVEALPEPAVAAAVTRLAVLIAKAARLRAAAPTGPGAGDE